MQPKYFPKNRQPQREEIIPFSIKKPIKLKPAIMGSGSKEHGHACLQELSLLLACFKQTNFSQVACATEVGDFHKCFYTANNQIQDSNTNNKQEKKPSIKNEVNKLLEKYSTK